MADRIENVKENGMGRAERVDLGFGVMTLDLKKITFEGRRGSMVTTGEGERRVGAASGTFFISIDNLIKMLGWAYLESLKSHKLFKGNDGGVKLTGGQRDETGRGEEQTGEGQVSAGSAGQVPRRRLRGEVVKQREERVTKDGRYVTEEVTLSTILDVIPRRQSFPGVRITVVQSKLFNGGEREVVARTTGVLTPFRLMSMFDIMGNLIRGGSQIYPYSLKSVVLVASPDRIAFQAGTVQSFLEKWQEKELKYLLAGKLFAPDKVRVNYRAGRMRLEETADGIHLHFGREETLLTSEDLVLLFAMLR